MGKTVKILSDIYFLICFFLLFELGTGGSFYLLHIFLVASLILLLRLCFQLSFKGILEKCIDVIKDFSFSMNTLIIFLGVYIGADLVSTFISPFGRLSFPKYKIILVMAYVFVLGAILSSFSENVRKIITLSLGLSGAVLGVFVFFNQFVFRLFPIYYALRLSLRRDYNMFSVAICVGAICLYYYVAKYKPKFLVLFFFSFGISLGIVILSGSRRGFLYGATIFFAIFILQFFEEKKEIRKNLLCFLATCLTLFSSYFAGKEGLTYFYENFGNEVVTEQQGSKGETGFEERLETMAKGGFFEKRFAIWEVAIDEIKKLTPKEMLFGKGSGYDLYIYQKTNSEKLWSLYDKEKSASALSPHCFLLSDFLSGGILRVVLGEIVVCFSFLSIASGAKKDKRLFAILFLGLGIVFSSALISGRFGFIYDRCFYLLGFIKAFEGKNEKS